MRRNNDTMRALVQIGELATMTMDTSEILGQVVAITAGLMKVDACSIYLYDSEGALVLESTVGLEADAVGKVKLRPGEGITGRAAKQGRIVSVSDVTKDKRNKFIALTGEETLHSILSVPLKFRNDNIGVINVQTLKPRTFQKKEKQLLKAIAHQVSGIIRNARLYENVLAAKKELEEANQKLIDSEKLAALGRLSATLSHELRNPLSGLKGASQLLYRKTHPDDERRQYITLILEEVERLGKIVDDLIHFARPRKLNRVMANPNDLIEDCVLLLGEDIRQHGITVRKRLSKLPSVEIDPDSFKQVVVNILLNAIDAMPEGGELLVSSSASIREESGPQIVSFHFKDSGTGIPEEVMPKIFEPFFTSKPNGVGLGLAVCKSILEMHGGSISASSSRNHGAGRGTLISFEIPIPRSPAKNPAF